MDRLSKEKDATLMKLRESANERERQLQSEIQTMSSKLEDSSVRLRQLEWNVQDLEKEKSNVLEKYARSNYLCFREVCSFKLSLKVKLQQIAFK